MLHSLRNNIINLGISHDFNDFSNCLEIWFEELVDACCYSQDILKQLNFVAANHDNACLSLAGLFLKLCCASIIVSKMQRTLGKTKFSMPIFNLVPRLFQQKGWHLQGFTFISKGSASIHLNT